MRRASSEEEGERERAKERNESTVEEGRGEGDQVQAEAREVGDARGWKVEVEVEGGGVGWRGGREVW